MGSIDEYYLVFEAPLFYNLYLGLKYSFFTLVPALEPGFPEMPGTGNASQDLNS